MANKYPEIRSVRIVDSEGVIIDSFGGSGGVSQEDGSAFTPGSSSLTPIGGYREDTPTTLADGDAGAVRLTEDRELLVSVANAGDIGGGTQYTEDDAAPSHPSGPAIMAKRDDALGGLTPAEGDWTQLFTDALGALWVVPNGNVAAGAVDAGRPVKVGGVASSSPPSSVDTGDRVDEWMSLQGAVIVGGAALSDADGYSVVHGIVRTNSGSGAPAAAALFGYNGASWDRLRSDTTNGLDVDVTRLPSLPAGSNNIGDVDVLTLPSLPSGSNAIGKLAANSGVDIGDVDVTSIAAGSNLIGDVGLRPRTSGGLSIFKSLDLDESEEDVKTSAGQVYMIAAFNRTAGPLYLKFYNATAASVTVGSTTPVATFVVPANADSDGAGFVLNVPQGLAFSTAICVACTTGVADSDTGAPSANDCVVVIGYA